MIAVRDVSPYVAREMARLYPERWTYDDERCEFSVSTRGERPQAPGAVPPQGAEEASMSRVTYRKVTFRRPFRLAGLDGRQPAGTYTVETEEELLETLSAPVYRRTGTLIHVTSGPGVKQGLPISPDDLDRALAMDAQ